MSRSKKTTKPATTLAIAFAAVNFSLPEKEVKKEWEWVGPKKQEKPHSRTTSSSLARTIVCGKKETGHPDGLLSIDEQAPLLMMDIMDGLK